MPAVVGREREAGLVPANPAVIRPDQQIVPIGGVEGDVFLGLPAEEAVLIDPDISVRIAVSAAERVRRDAQIPARGSTGGRTCRTGTGQRLLRR
jgi:hypothetical protein